MKILQSGFHYYSIDLKPKANLIQYHNKSNPYYFINY